jgi:outer membrane immunogenic protein
MKKLFFGTAIALVSAFATTQMSAQDCCFPPQYDGCCYGVDFNGLYVGGNVGVLSHTQHRNDYDDFLTSGSWTTIETNVAGGAQLGWDMQCCQKLLGVVWDWNWTRTERNVNVTLEDEPTVHFFVRRNIDWFTTIRARAGLTVCDALVYVTLGGAIARFEQEWGRTPDQFHHRSTRGGWVAGAGTEFIVWCNWSIGLEVLYLQFSEHTTRFTAFTGGTFRVGHSDSIWFGRVLLNYRFGDLFCF